MNQKTEKLSQKTKKLNPKTHHKKNYEGFWGKELYFLTHRSRN